MKRELKPFIKKSLVRESKEKGKGWAPHGPHTTGSAPPSFG